MPTIALAGTGPVAAMLTVAAQRLGWRVAAVAGDEPRPLAGETGAPIVELPALLTDPRADIVVVDTTAPARAGNAEALLARGAHVVLAPGMSVDDARRVVDAEQRSSASLIMGDVFPAAPVVQRWFAELTGLGDVTHLSGRAGGLGFDWPLLAVGVLSARVAGWGAPVDDAADAAAAIKFTSSDSSARLSFDETAGPSAQHWELQAASPSSTLRVEMLPHPGLERDGEPMPSPARDDPASTFGAIALLRTFHADIEAGRRPILDATFALTIERLRTRLGGLSQAR